MKPCAILVLPIFLMSAAIGRAAAGPEFVARHAITLNAPAGAPTQYMPSGPLLGNGDVGVMQSGPAEQLIYYIGKNDFWSIKYQSPIAVGQLRILTPALQGAKFQTVSDMRLAEIRGDYARGDVAMTSRAWVDAKQNLLCVELSNKGSKPLAISLQNSMGAGTSVVPSSVPASPSPVKIGCEQYGGGRWFFNGEMADVTILDRALSLEEITTPAKGARKDVQTFDGKAGKPLAAPDVSKVLTIAGWVKAASLSNVADYIVSKGDWNHAYDPKKILAELNNMYSNHALPNKLLSFGGGGIENVSPALGVTEMLLQSHEGVIRFFPCWPRNQDARFGTLRAKGAFLVSAELKGGVASGVKITSEKGGDCVVQNPWPDKSVRVIRNGQPTEVVSGPRFTLKTAFGETIVIEPEVTR